MKASRWPSRHRFLVGTATSAAAVALIHQHLAADGAVPTSNGERPVGDVS